MNQKIFAVLVTIAIILGVVNLILLFFWNSQIGKTSSNTAQEIPLNSVYMEMQKVSGENITDYYRVRITASIPDEPLTMFNVVLEMNYLTESNTWKTLSEYHGIVNFHSLTGNNVAIGNTFNMGNDFQNDDKNLETNQAFLSGYLAQYAGNNIRVEAFGTLKP